VESPIANSFPTIRSATTRCCFGKRFANGSLITSRSDIAQDTELASWCQDLVSHEGGRVFGFGDNGKINTIRQLVDSLTLIIYTGSVQHAAVNFPQYDLMTYCPNMPLAAYHPAPKSTSGATEQDYLNILPPMDQAEAQLNLLYVLGTVHYTTLGEYAADQFRDDRVRQPLQRFQQRLADIKTQINQRNQKRRPYETLLPASVPQSINI
jgi:arachidonate 15-lipoxygenase